MFSFCGELIVRTEVVDMLAVSHPWQLVEVLTGRGQCSPLLFLDVTPLQASESSR